MKKKSYLKLRLLTTGLSIALFSGAAQAGELIWANNASLGNPHIQAYDLSTGNLVIDFVAPNKDAHNGQANGRGIAVVGTQIYYSLANTGKVYLTDSVTHADKGIAFSTPLPGIAALSWDGTGLWVAPYVFLEPAIPSSLNVYKYSVTGALLKTVSLPEPADRNGQQLEPRDGFVATPSELVAGIGPSNPYSQFDVTGNLVNEYFITSSSRTTGLSFDGTQYIAAAALNGSRDNPAPPKAVFADHLLVFDANGIFLRSVSIPSAGIPFALEGLAAAQSTTRLGQVFLSPTTVLGGNTVSGIVTIGPASTQNVTVNLASSNGSVAMLPKGSTVVIPAGKNSASFSISTSAVVAPTPITLSASFAGGVRTASVIVVPAPTLASLSMSPASVLGANGNGSQGTVTLSNSAPQPTTVSLASSNPALVTVPSPGVSVPTGSSAVNFEAVVFNSVHADTTVTITATLGSDTRTTSLNVLATTPTDQVHITQAQYDLRGNLNVQATSTSAMANLSVYVTSTGQLLGLLANGGGGTYKRQITNVFPNPQNITVKSSLGGSDVSAVTAK